MTISKSSVLFPLQVMFETFDVPSMFTVNQGVLSLLASGRTTGLVIDSGHSVSHAIPIHQGRVIHDAAMRFDLAGQDITELLIRILQERGYSFTTTAERMMVRDMKEKLAYVALNYDDELKNASTNPSLEKHYEPCCDGSFYRVVDERFRCMEVLFNPILIGSKRQGFHDVAYSSIMRCEADMREELTSNIVLCGGTTCCPGFAQRMQKEIQQLAPQSMKVEVVDPPGRLYTTWMGGCQFVENVDWITKEEYDEYGPSIVHKKCT